MHTLYISEKREAHHLRKYTRMFLPEGKTDTVDEENQYRQTEDPQKSVHSDL